MIYKVITKRVGAIQRRKYGRLEKLDNTNIQIRISENSESSVAIKPPRNDRAVHEHRNITDKGCECFANSVE